MTEVKPFKTEDLKELINSGFQDVKLKPFIKPEHGVAMEQQGKTYTVFEDNKVVCIGGIMEHWAIRGEAWLILGKPSPHSFATIFKMVQRGINMSILKRIEMVIDYDFAEGHRWANLLGFKKEAEKLKCYRPDGSDVSLYALVRE